MSEPQHPPVPPYGQPSPTPQAAPQPPTAQPYSPQQPYQQPAQPYQQQPYAQPQSPALDGAPQGHPGAAPQHFGQQQPGGDYPVPGYPGTGYPARPAASGKALGRTALIIALIAFAVGVLGSFLYPLLYGAFSYSSGFSYGIISGVTGFLVLVGSTVALILGLMAIRRPGSPVLAGIAIGIAASEIAGTVISWISSLFYAFV
ncbi:hypothetical protein QFZ53_000164 [Microbacterium natoriense]|uniref:DUF4190 domain-containing protein n=1 Tax=Microbacterium natoriense TaxID=284570 RepID=A0AAW8ERV2_9MICO|nr:hypothetical protein [Microbacterium natoriense]MDQ0645968.1 hypothetical protein [Microbacterium natoriense]